jgi:LemA protein
MSARIRIMAKEEKPIYMKPWIWALAIVVVLVLLLWGSYNNFVVLSQNADGQWAQVQAQYQRRIDLIPNLVNSVKGYMQFESSLLQNITALRSQWTSATTVEDQVNTGNALDSALGRLLVVYENYPTLKSDTLVAGLMDELAGTENRIAVERMRYNDAIRAYNTAIQTFPSVLFANAFGFRQRTYFQATPGSEIAPTVNLTG